MQRRSIILFVKNPVEGKVKTRIAATVGSQKAVAIYKEILAYTHQILTKFLQKQPCSVAVYYGDVVNPNDLWNDIATEKFLQQGNDLGERMMNAFKQQFEAGNDSVVIIGSDCLAINETHLQQAFDALINNEVVIGPATDGGYYLLGMRELRTNLFSNKSWSQPTLLQETLQDLPNNSYQLLDKLSDIDTWEDYILHRK